MYVHLYKVNLDFPLSIVQVELFLNFKTCKCFKEKLEHLFCFCKTWWWSHYQVPVEGTQTVISSSRLPDFVLTQLRPHIHCSYCSPCADVAKMLSAGVRFASWQRNCWDVRKQYVWKVGLLTICYLLLGLLLESFNASCGAVLRCKTLFFFLH